MKDKLFAAAANTIAVLGLLFIAHGIVAATFGA